MKLGQVADQFVLTSLKWLKPISTEILKITSPSIQSYLF